MEFLENVLVIFFSLIILNMILIRNVGFVLFFWTVGQVLLCPSLQAGQIFGIPRFPGFRLSPPLLRNPLARALPIGRRGHLERPFNWSFFLLDVRNFLKQIIGSSPIMTPFLPGMEELSC